jgi:hypothetical protein
MKVRRIVEELAAAFHEDWRQQKRRHRVKVWPSPWGENLMVPWGQLSERAKNVNRRAVRKFFRLLAELT